ncbi:hypothetical protein HID58_090588 [Brassica napus]|uniref:Protein kinase domain-containing protein n=1 Tax=Brassica napus TaxID=3708 RepID=A0ABQ7WW81_BRANA|nr:hypothetical protein HID58_090588 [Brassica napus]
MASSLFIFFLTSLSNFLPLSVLSATVLEDLATLTPPPDFTTTITTNCLHNPLLRYCNNTSSPMNITEIFRSTIVASHLCNESKNPNCIDSFPKIRIHSRPKTAALYLSFDFFWKYCPLTVVEFHTLRFTSRCEALQDESLGLVGCVSHSGDSSLLLLGMTREQEEWSGYPQRNVEKRERGKDRGVYREGFEREEAVLKLRHKNLVKVLGWCNSRNLRALVTEWTNGENVETWLSSSLASSWRRRLRVVMGVVEGVCYLWEQWPEITFDLNTSSVLLSDDDQEPLISQFKIGDGTVHQQIYSTLDCFFWR